MRWKFDIKPSQKSIENLISAVSANPDQLPNVLWHRKRRLTAVWAFRTEDGLFYWKEFICPTPVVKLKHLWRGSPARHTAKVSEALRESGIRTPEIICTGRRTLRGQSRPFMITAAVPETVSLNQALNQFWPSGMFWDSQRRAFFRHLGRQLAVMHNRGFIHPDLNLTNVLVSPSEPQKAMYLLDLEKVRKPLRMTLQLRVKNLVRTASSFAYNYTLHDRAAIFSGYWPSSEGSKVERHKFWNQLGRRFEAITIRESGKLLHSIEPSLALMVRELGVYNAKRYRNVPQPPAFQKPS